MKVLRLEGITKKYRNYSVKIDELCIESGNIYSVIGNYDSGSTQLFEIIAGLSMADKGNISIMESEYQRQAALERRKCGFMLKENNFNPNQTVAQCIREICKIKDIYDEAEYVNVLKQTGMLEYTDVRIKDLKKTSQSMISFAAAILGDIKLLILEEPFVYADRLTKDKMMEIIDKLAIQRQVAVVVFDNDAEFAKKNATHLILMKNGQCSLISSKMLEAKYYIEVKTNSVRLATAAIEEKLNSHDYVVLNDDIIRIFNIGNTERVFDVMSGFGLKISYLCKKQGDYFEEISKDILQ